MPGFHEGKVRRVLAAFDHHRQFVETVGGRSTLFGRIFHMEEVPIEFRAYYRVEVVAPPVEPARLSAEAEGEGEGDPGLAAVGGGAGRFGRARH